MSGITDIFVPSMNASAGACAEVERRIEESEPSKIRSFTADSIRPNSLVRWAFYLSVFAIPFTRLYLPGTGDRIGVTRLVQALMICAVISQPRVCLRLVPMALIWFLGYCVLRLFLGAWLAPGQAYSWWPDTLEWLQLSLPWLWVAFNILQYRGVGRNGLWALIAGCSVCALFHIAGIGVVDVPDGFEGRSTVFGENANVAGAMYAVAMIALVGLGMCGDAKPMHRWLPLPLIAVLGAGMAKTGSRTAVLILVVGILVLFFQRGTLGARAKRFATLLLVGAMLAGVISAIPTVLQRFEMMDSSSMDRQEGRVRMMPVLWEMFLRSPVYGSGPSDYRFELTRRAMPHLIQENRVIVAHNLLLKLLVETGVIGFLLFAAGIKGALASAWRARVRPCGFLPLALLLPLLGASLVLSDPSHHWVFWVATAYALAGTA